MFKVDIKIDNIVTGTLDGFQTEQLAQDWVTLKSSQGLLGKLEREVREIAPGILDNNEDISKSVSSRQEEIMGETVTIHTLPQEFTHTITNITAQIESQEALAYLASTDWMVVRKAETNVDYPQEVKDLRAAARLKVL